MIFLLPAALAAAAAAQPTRLATTRGTYRCLIGRDRTESERLAGSVPDSREEMASFNKLLTLSPSCFKAAGTDKQAVRPLDLAAGLAGTLYLEHVISRRILWTTQDGEARVVQSVATKAERWPTGAAAAECLIAREPLAGDRLVRSKIGSTRERQVLDRLVTLLPSCLFEGRPLAISRLDLRSHVILAAYRHSWGGIVRMLNEGGPIGLSIPSFEKTPR